MHPKKPKPPAALRKAAILISALDTASADRLLDQMSPEQAAKVRQAVLDLDDVPPAEQQHVLREFLRTQQPDSVVFRSAKERSFAERKATNDDDSGIELDSSLARRLSSRPPEPPAESEPPPFRFLHEAATDTLVRYLNREHPQTVAVVVSHLPPPRAAEIISQLPTELQADVLVRVANLSKADREIIREVERGLESVLADELELLRHRAEGLSAVNAILQSLDGSGRSQVVAAIAQRDGRLADQVIQPARVEPRPAPAPAPRPSLAARFAERIRPAPPKPKPEPKQPQPPPAPTLRFADLEQLDDRSLAAALQATDPDVAILALTGASRSFVDRILRQLASKDAKQIRKQMEQLGPLRLSDVQAAQQDLARVTAELIASGSIRSPVAKRFAVAA